MCGFATPIASNNSALADMPRSLLQELELLDEDSNIFKLIGPILVKQDPLEATSNVKKRLDFIKGDLERLDSQLRKLEDKQTKRQNTVSQTPLNVILLLLLARCHL